jgi:phospholipase/lecithinase/hemolysin
MLGLPAAHAGPYDAEYVFGDSLSDNGNLAALFGLTFPNPPSYHDSFTNGPVAVSLLAQSLGLSLNPSLWLTSPIPAGTNYAVGGAIAAAGGPLFPGGPNINLPTQIEAYSAFEGGVADKNALYVVMIGGNDVRDAALGGTGTVDPTGTDAIEAGVTQELLAISTLSSEGAKDFLVVNVPNVGLIPEFAQDNPTLANAATDYSNLYDSQLAAGLGDLGLPAGDRLSEFNLFAFNADVLKDPGSYGFTNTMDPCFTNTNPLAMTAATTPECGVNGANIASFIYWDDIHPTANVHALWAQGMEAAIPEPSTWAMLLLGFAVTGFAGYASSRKASAA